jgi:hypothetical protein
MPRPDRSYKVVVRHILVVRLLFNIAALSTPAASSALTMRSKSFWRFLPIENLSPAGTTHPRGHIVGVECIIPKAKASLLANAQISASSGLACIVRVWPSSDDPTHVRINLACSSEIVRHAAYSAVSLARVLARCADSSASLADAAASPAFWSASVNFATSYLWMALCASSNLAPHFHSAISPITTIIKPTLSSRFTHLGSSECNSLSRLHSPAGNTLATSSSSIRSRFVRLFCLAHTAMSWMSSTPSRATPTATVMFAHPTRLEIWSARACSASLIGSAIGESESISNELDGRLLYVVIGAIILYAFCKRNKKKVVGLATRGSRCPKRWITSEERKRRCVLASCRLRLSRLPQAKSARGNFEAACYRS